MRRILTAAVAVVLAAACSAPLYGDARDLRESTRAEQMPCPPGHVGREVIVDLEAREGSPGHVYAALCVREVAP